MFKTEHVFEIPDAEVVNFCNALGKYGLKFKIGRIRNVPNIYNPFDTYHYRRIKVCATDRQVRKLCEEMEGEKESDF